MLIVSRRDGVIRNTSFMYNRYFQFASNKTTGSGKPKYKGGNLKYSFTYNMYTHKLRKQGLRCPPWVSVGLRHLSHNTPDMFLIGYVAKYLLPFLPTFHLFSY